MSKMIFLFIASLSIMACEDNNKAEDLERSEFEGVNLDSVDIVAEDGSPTDYYDSVEQKWYGEHADRLNGVDTSYIEGVKKLIIMKIEYMPPGMRITLRRTPSKSNIVIC